MAFETGTGVKGMSQVKAREALRWFWLESCLEVFEFGFEVLVKKVVTRVVTQDATRVPTHVMTAKFTPSLNKHVCSSKLLTLSSHRPSHVCRIFPLFHPSTMTTAARSEKQVEVE
jgi:hypothetical protein